MLTGLAGSAIWIAALALQSDDAAADVQFLEPSIRMKCSCRDALRSPLIHFEGIVVDAEVTVAPDGRTPNDRQATIFDIQPGNAAGVRGRTRIFHSSDTKKCGVVFDYGKSYNLTVRKTADGQYETDWCLMRPIPPLE